MTLDAMVHVVVSVAPLIVTLGGAVWLIRSWNRSVDGELTFAEATEPILESLRARSVRRRARGRVKLRRARARSR